MSSNIKGSGTGKGGFITDTKKGTIHYFIKWTGWGPEHNTWEPVENIDQEALDEFNRRTETSIPNITTVRKTNRKWKALTSRAKTLDEFFHSSFKRGSMQECGILPHSRTYYCLIFSLYRLFIIFVISY